MSEIASNIKRICPEGVSSQIYVFTTDTVPPRFAMVDVVDSIFSASGPLTEVQLAVELAHVEDKVPLTSQELDAYYAPNSLEYAVQVVDIHSTGDYPGGHYRLAFNIARLVLGA